MAISHRDAVDSLNLIHDTATRARRAVVAGYAGNLLILWGLVWIAGFTAGPDVVRILRAPRALQPVDGADGGGALLGTGLYIRIRWK